jgi:hypothetical protein
MQQPIKSATLPSIQDVQAQIEEVEVFLSAGDHLAAMVSLLKARNDLRQIVVILIVECLRKNLEVCEGVDDPSIDQRLSKLTEILNFALLALCPDCQNQISARIKDKDYHE